MDVEYLKTITKKKRRRRKKAKPPPSAFKVKGRTFNGASKLYTSRSQHILRVDDLANPSAWIEIHIPELVEIEELRKKVKELEQALLANQSKIGE